MSTIYPHEMSLCSIPLTQLATHEVGLDDGRFIHFARYTQEHLIGYWHESSIEEDFKTKLDWVSKNVHSEWHFELTMEHVGKVRCLWSFQDPAEAVLFKLTF